MSTEVKHQDQEQRQEPKQQHIEWRRERVAELSAQGRTEREIATILKVSLATVSRDLTYLNKQAHENLKNHINHKIPEQYQRCCNGLSQVLKMAWNIVILDSVNQANKLQALSLISDCYRYQMDLSTNAGVISKAMDFMNEKHKQIETLNRLEETIKADEQEMTTSGVF
jgi:hypothetical protein